MATGTVKWFYDSKVFGFITPRDAGDNVVAHVFSVNGDAMGSQAARPVPRA
jgi:cold shock protein